MMSLAVVLVVTYLAYVFFAESFNPLAKPRLHVEREQWRYGRRMALAVLIGGLTFIALSSLTELTFQIAISAGLIIAAVLGLCFSMGKIREMLVG